MGYTTFETQDENRNESEEMKMDNNQLAIGCAVAGAVLCFCVMVWKVRTRNEGKGEIYDTLEENEQPVGIVQNSNVVMEVEGGIPTKRTDVEMNSTSLIGS